ncbi:MAG: hypothetical protein WBM40_06575, partial [Thiohalocapsa sp.]
CRARAETSPDWQRACSQYAARKARDANTILGRSVGMGLQDVLAEIAGTPVAPARRDARDREVLDRLTDSLGEDGQVLLATDENIGLAWMDRLANSGEIAANEFLRAEVVRVRLIPGYNPCPSAEPTM